jgi:transcription elongation factor GreA
MGKIKYYTEEGLNALKEELESINVFDSKKISQQIAEARDKGDLSENAGI